MRRNPTRSGEGPSAPIAPVPEVTIHFETAGCVMGLWKNISVVVWGTQATMAMLAEFERLAQRVLQQHRKGSAIQIVLDGVPIPSAELRAEMQAMTARHEQHIACSATLIQGDGFWASGMRSLVTGMRLLRPRRFKSTTGANPQEIATWLAKPHTLETGVAVEEAELISVMNTFLAQPALRRENR